VPLLSIVASALGFGRPLRRQRKVSYATDLDSAVAIGHGPFPYQVDGDFLGETDRLEFKHTPGALSLVVPLT
jgi:diacylglycerol kinase family enzyme